MDSIVFKECCLYINGEEVVCGDELIRLTSELALGNPLPILDKFDFDEDELMDLEILLSDQIFGPDGGHCLTPDEDQLEQLKREVNDDNIKPESVDENIID